MPLMPFGTNTKKDQYHIACSCSYKAICVDDRYSKPYKTYFVEGAIDKFLKDTVKESKYFSKVTQREFNKPLSMTGKDHKTFKNSTKC